MAADDHVRRTFEALAERLCDEISRELAEASGPLAATLDEERAARLAEASADADRLVEAVAAADARRTDALAEAEQRHAEALAAVDARHAEALAETEARHAAALATAVADADDRHAGALAVAESVRSTELAASERLADAMRSLDHGRSLSEILDTLVSCAGREAPRVGLLLVRGSHLRAWRFIGFGSSLDETSQYEMPMADAGIIGDAVRTGATVSGDSAAHASAPSFAELPSGRETLALPVPIRGHVVAVLYADQGAGETEARTLLSWRALLEVMARHAARCLEAITAQRAAQVLAERPDVPPLADGDGARIA